MHERTAHNELEKSFAEKWESENQMRPWLNFGHGILQDLFMKGSHYFPECHHEVTASERMVAATVVQWLGTNVGHSFLEAALSDAGYKIVKQDSPNVKVSDEAGQKG
jgi:hypothetical protein